MPDLAPLLVIETPGGRLSTRLDPNANVCATLARLADMAPVPSTWWVMPARTS